VRVAKWVVEVVEGTNGRQQRSTLGVDSLSDALSAGFETRCVGWLSVVGALECVSRFTPDGRLGRGQRNVLLWTAGGGSKRVVSGSRDGTITSVDVE
jgi:hypothetical protein